MNNSIGRTSPSATLPYTQKRTENASSSQRKHAKKKRITVTSNHTIKSLELTTPNKAHLTTHTIHPSALVAIHSEAHLPPIAPPSHYERHLQLSLSLSARKRNNSVLRVPCPLSAGGQGECAAGPPRWPCRRQSCCRAPGTAPSRDRPLRASAGEQSRETEQEAEETDKR
jgi:hypothetical protein